MENETSTQSTSPDNSSNNSLFQATSTMPWAAVVVIVIKIIVVVMVIVVLLRAATAVPDVQGDVTRRGSKQFQLTLTQETLFSTVAEGT